MTKLTKCTFGDLKVGEQFTFGRDADRISVKIADTYGHVNTNALNPTKMKMNVRRDMEVWHEQEPLVPVPFSQIKNGQRFWTSAYPDTSIAGLLKIIPTGRKGGNAVGHGINFTFRGADTVFIQKEELVSKLTANDEKIAQKWANGYSCGGFHSSTLYETICKAIAESKGAPQLVSELSEKQKELLEKSERLIREGMAQVRSLLDDSGLAALGAIQDYCATIGYLMVSRQMYMEQLGVEVPLRLLDNKD